MCRTTCLKRILCCGMARLHLTESSFHDGDELEAANASVNCMAKRAFKKDGSVHISPLIEAQPVVEKSRHFPRTEVRGQSISRSSAAALRGDERSPAGIISGGNAVSSHQRYDGTINVPSTIRCGVTEELSHFQIMPSTWALPALSATCQRRIARQAPSFLTKHLPRSHALSAVHTHAASTVALKESLCV